MKGIYIVILLAMTAYSGIAQDLGEMLREAAAAKDKSYIEARNRIVAKGMAIVPELEKILADERNDWRDRAMAGIVMERIAKGERIAALLNHDWRNDPVLRDETGWIETPGGSDHDRLGELVRLRLDEAQLNYYYLELGWKPYGREYLGPDMYRVNHWEEAERAGNPFVLHVWREGAREEDEKERVWVPGGYHDLLLRARDRESLSYLFDVWIKDRPKSIELYIRNIRQDEWRTEENIKMHAARQADSRLGRLLEMADKDDADWIVDKVKDLALSDRGQRFMREYLERIRTGRSSE